MADTGESTASHGTSQRPAVPFLLIIFYFFLKTPLLKFANPPQTVRLRTPSNNIPPEKAVSRRGFRLIPPSSFCHFFLFEQILYFQPLLNDFKPTLVADVCGANVLFPSVQFVFHLCFFSSHFWIVNIFFLSSLSELWGTGRLKGIWRFSAGKHGRIFKHLDCFLSVVCYWIL